MAHEKNKEFNSNQGLNIKINLHFSQHIVHRSRVFKYFLKELRQIRII